MLDHKKPEEEKPALVKITNDPGWTLAIFITLWFISYYLGNILVQAKRIADALEAKPAATIQRLPEKKL